MNDLDMPILKKSYDLYKTFHEYRRLVPKTDRFTIYERSEGVIIDVVECLIEAGYGQKDTKTALLEKASVKLNTFRFFIRLMKESKTIDSKKYIILQGIVDEIGRMLGGWIRSAAK
jgi:hypothetical protein